jgi:hypothetical protein
MVGLIVYSRDTYKCARGHMWVHHSAYCYPAYLGGDSNRLLLRACMGIMGAKLKLDPARCTRDADTSISFSLFCFQC